MKKVFDGKTDCYYWQDDGGNRWRVSVHTKKEAEKLSQTLTNCKDCLECSYCHSCVRCTSCDFCTLCTECVGCGYCYECSRCSTVGYALFCTRCLCCTHCTACDYCVNISECSCVRNKINGHFLGNIKDGGDLERAAMLCSLATDIGARVGKWGSAKVKSGGRLCFIFGRDSVRIEYPSEKGGDEELVDVYRPTDDPIHPPEISDSRREFVLRHMPKEARKLVRLWQAVVVEDDKEKGK